MNRRTFLQTAALSALAATSSFPFTSAQTPSAQRFREARERRQTRVDTRRGQTTATKIPIGVQLYSVRNLARQDLAGTLAAIAKMGYEGVEFAGYYDKDPKDIRKMLDDTGLKCCGTHTGFSEIRGDRFGKTAEIHKTLGTKFIIVPGGLDKDSTNIEKIKEWADEFNAIAEKAKALDLVIGYHAHGRDSNLIDGVSIWERFFEATVPEVVMQMDLGNYKDGGGDPYMMIEKFKGRSKTIHLKEGGPGSPIIGSGTVEWQRAFDLCETVGGTEWYVVEDEKEPDSLNRIEKCLVALREMGK